MCGAACAGDRTAVRWGEGESVKDDAKIYQTHLISGGRRRDSVAISFFSILFLALLCARKRLSERKAGEQARESLVVVVGVVRMDLRGREWRARMEVGCIRWEVGGGSIGWGGWSLSWKVDDKFWARGWDGGRG